MLQRVLLACGILSALLYAGADILGGLLRPGYRFDSESASVLSAWGTTTRPFMLPLLLTADVLLIAFAKGMWFSGEGNWALRVTAGLVAGNSICSMVAVAFFPLRLDAATNAPANTMNAISMGIGVLCFLLTMVFGAVANHNWFRYYSIGTPLIFLALAVVRLTDLLPVPAGRSLVGTQERTMIAGWLLWLVFQALVLLRA